MPKLESEKEKKIPWPFECYLFRVKDDGTTEKQKVSSFSNDFNKQEYQENPLRYSPSEREVAETKAKAKVEEMLASGWYDSPQSAKAGKEDAAKRQKEIEEGAAKLAAENKAKEDAAKQGSGNNQGKKS